MTKSMKRSFAALLMLLVFVLITAPQQAQAAESDFLDYLTMPEEDEATYWACADNPDEYDYQLGVMGAVDMNHTFTITNKTETKIKVTFTYDSINYGEGTHSVSFNNASDVNGLVTATLEGGESFTVTLAITTNAGENDCWFNMHGITVEEIKAAKVTINSCDTSLGTVSPSGEVEIPETGLALTATTKNGSKFLGWVDQDNKILSTSASFTLNATKGLTSVKACFAATSPWFQVPDTGASYLIEGLNEAAAKAAKTSAKSMVLMNNATLASGKYEVPAGVNMIIPFDDAHTACIGMPNIVKTARVNPTAYRTLTMASGAELTVKGGLSVAGSQTGNMGAVKNSLGLTTSTSNGAPTGPLGMIQMAGNSSIVVASGGNLYAWGYIYRADAGNEGTVTVQKGGTVYENFQVADFRGGTFTSTMVTGSAGGGLASALLSAFEIPTDVFPFSQYYIQNVQVPLTIQAGGTENLVFAAQIGDLDEPISPVVEFVGIGAGMFRIADDGKDGSITKDYLENQDRMCFSISGTLTMGNIVLDLTAGGTSLHIDSSQFVLPLNGNITVDILAGSNLTVSQQFCILPEAEMYIREGATVTLAKNVFLYDGSDWGDKFCGANNVRLAQVNYAWPKVEVTRDLKDDAQLVIGGTLKATDGKLYITNNHPGVKGEGESGKVVITNSGTTTTRQASIEKKKVIIWEATLPNSQKITAKTPLLIHADGKTLNTSSDNSTTHYYAHGVWHTGNTEPKAQTLKAQAATCTATGLTEGSKCSACDHIYVAQQTVPMVAHTTANSAQVDATCTTDGMTAGTYCSVCNTTLSGRETIGKLNHDWNTATYNMATDGKSCTASRTCKRDGSHVENATATITTNVKTAATCTTMGTTTYTATFTESWADTQTLDVVDIAINPKNHSYTAYTYNNDAKCGVDGTETAACDYACGGFDNREKAGTALDHQDTDKNHVCDRNCGKDDMGTHADADKNHTCDYGCSVKIGDCKDENPKDHYCDYGAESATGCRQYFGTCSDAADDGDHVCDYGCGVVLEACSDVLTDNNHNCDVCGAENVSGHSYGEWEQTKAPSCEVAGSKKQTCNCGHEVTAEVPALSHSWSTATYSWEKVNNAWTCTATRTCTTEGGCGATETANATVTSNQTLDPTYNAMGQTTYTATFDKDWTQTQNKVETDVAMLEGEARVGNTNYGTLADAVANVGKNDTITVLKNLKVTETVTIPKGVTLDFNGFTVEGTVLGTLKINNGLLVTAQGYKMIGNGATYYSASDDVVLTMVDVAGSITIHSGTVNMLTDNWSLPGQTLTVGEKAQFVVPDGVQLNVNDATVVINGEASISGTVNLYSANATITVGDKGSIKGTDKIITNAGDKVLYNETDKTYSVHSHTAGEAVVEDKNEPTCTETGSYNSVVYCSVCGDKLSTTPVTVDALTHDWKDPEYKWDQADGKWTCTATRSCGRANCNETETATAEVTSAEKEAATCTEMGWTTYTASFNVTWAETQTQDKQDIAVIAHTYTVEAVNENTLKSVATCTEKAVYYYSCQCSAVDKSENAKTFEYGDELGHTYGDPAVTFSEDGKTYTVTVTCSVCAVGTTGHTSTSGTLNSAAGDLVPGTCQAESYQIFTAAGAFEEVSYSDTKTVYGEKGDHDWDCDCGYTSVNDSEDNLTGYTFSAARTCKTNGCDAHEVANPEVSLTESQKATCVATGIGTYTVTFDKKWAETKTYENLTTPIAPDNHANVVNYPAVDPTCTTAGNDAWSKCSDADGAGCGKTLVEYKAVDMLPHTPAEAVVEKEIKASCLVDGSHDEVIYCSVCKTHVIERKTVVDKAPGHKEVIDEKVDATFDAPGKTEGKHCETCDEVLVAQTVIPQKVAIAQIGTQKYQTLNEAIIAANASTAPVTIELLAVVDTAPETFVSAEITFVLTENTALTWVNAYSNLRALKSIAADGFNVETVDATTFKFVRSAVAEPETGEAAIGDKIYVTLAAAIADAKNGAFINLKADVSEVPANIGKDLVIIPNGFKLAGTEGDAALALLQGKMASGYAVRTNYGLFFINKQTNGSGIVAKIGDVGYYTVKEALEAAKNGDTVVMVADSNESQSDMIMVPGVTLYLGVYDLSVRSLVGAEGSKVYGETYHATKDYCKLFAPNLILGSVAPKVSGVPTIPVRNPDLGCYIFSKFDFATSYEETGIRYYPDDTKIHFQFGQGWTTAVQEKIIASKYTAADNKFKIVVQITWEGTTGNYVQEYIFTDYNVGYVSAKNNRQYYYDLIGYDKLELNTQEKLEKMRIQAVLVTDSGVRVSTDQFSIADSKN